MSKSTLDDFPLVLTPEQATRVLPFGLTRIYSLLRAGTLPAKRVGGKWLIPRHALERWLDALDDAGRQGE